MAPEGVYGKKFCDLLRVVTVDRVVGIDSRNRQVLCGQLHVYIADYKDKSNKLNPYRRLWQS